MTTGSRDKNGSLGQRKERKDVNALRSAHRGIGLSRERRKGREKWEFHLPIIRTLLPLVSTASNRRQGNASTKSTRACGRSLSRRVA